MRRVRPSLLAIACALSCSSDGGGGSDPSPDATAIDFDRSAMLANLARNVVLPTYETFAEDAAAMVPAVMAYCDSLGGPDEAATRAGALAGWAAAMSTWQRAELMIIGPASKDGDALRDLIYSWPIVSACAVDGDVMLLRNDPTSYDIGERFPNRRGLDGLEYVLHTTSLDSVCSAQPPGWEELNEAERRAARCAYALVATRDLANQALLLRDAWRPEGGDFASELASAGKDGSSFATIEDGLNAAFGALFYLDTKTKDAKLGKPAGLLLNVCGTTGEACPQALESQYAHRSKDNVAANLHGFEMMFFGNSPDGIEGSGFDDYLRALGADELADHFETETGDARATIDALPDSLLELLTSDLDAVIQAHSEIRDVTGPLKQDAPDLLGLKIPEEAGGDTD